MCLYIADWTVHVRTDGTVAFQNQQYHGKWLRIKDDIADCEVSKSITIYKHYHDSVGITPNITHAV